MKKLSLKLFFLIIVVTHINYISAQEIITIYVSPCETDCLGLGEDIENFHCLYWSSPSGGEIENPNTDVLRVCPIDGDIYNVTVLDEDGSVLQEITYNFTYVDCGCSEGEEPQVELTIYNGLFIEGEELGISEWGGQEVLDHEEVSKGAITVANLNDTNGNGVPDKEDDIVEANSKGRDEVDLMKLDVSINGTANPACGFVYFNLSPGLRLWEESTKVTNIDIGRIPISDLPISIYVEAIDVSSSIKDMRIIAGFLDASGEMIGTDEVTVTSMWAEIGDSYLERTSTPTPQTLGINEPLLDTIITRVFSSVDNTLYGQGPNFPAPVGPSGAQVDENYGGRILMNFTISPPDLIPVLHIYDVMIDITRRKKINVRSTSYRVVDSIRIVNWPMLLEESNDDPDNCDANDSLDEDTSPTSGGDIFSYDAPSSRRIGHPEGHLVRSKRYFEEFVRVSFGTDPVGNSLEGSQASEKLKWEATFDAAVTSSILPQDPFYYRGSKLDPILSEGIHHTAPVCLQMNSGNGEINITPLSMTSDIDAYSLYYDIANSRWIFYTVDSATGISTPVLASTTTSTNPLTWLIEYPNVSINITEGTTPFRNTDYSFFIFKIGELIPSRIRTITTE